MSAVAPCVPFDPPLKSHSRINRYGLLDGRSPALESLQIHKILTRIQVRFEGSRKNGTREPWPRFPVELERLDGNDPFWTTRLSRKGGFSVVGLR